MPLEQALPDLQEGRGVKDIIIHVLSEEWPLSSNEIYTKAKRKYGLNSTYQAVHKMLKQLANQGVLAKEGKKYSISMKWAEKIEKFSKDLKTMLVSHKPLYLEGLSDFREETGMQTFVFDSFGTAEEYRKTLQKQYIESPGPKPPYVGQSRHLKSPVFYSEKSKEILDLINKTQTKCYLLVRGNTKIDGWCADYYRNNLVDIRTGVDVARNCDTMVVGNVVVQTYVPVQCRLFIDNLYSSAKNIPLIEIPKLYENIYKLKENTKLLVFKNPELAEQVRQQTIEYFNEKKATDPANELFEIVDESDKVIGTEKRSVVHEKGLLHRTSDVFVLDDKSRIFIQQRSFKKLIGPGLWDVSAAEHLKPGETYEETAARGVKEELGVKPISIEKIGEREQRYKFEKLYDNGKVQVFQCGFEGKIKIDKAEIEEGKWVSKEDLLEEMEKSPRKFTPWLLQDIKFVKLL